MESMKIYENPFFFCEYPHLYALIDYNIISGNLIEYSLRNPQNFDILTMPKDKKTPANFFKEFKKLITDFYLHNSYLYGKNEIIYDYRGRAMFTGFTYEIKAEKSNYMRLYVRRYKT